MIAPTGMVTAPALSVDHINGVGGLLQLESLPG
jgi:hypothetical protein